MPRTSAIEKKLRQHLKDLTEEAERLCSERDRLMAEFEAKIDACYASQDMFRKLLTEKKPPKTEKKTNG